MTFELLAVAGELAGRTVEIEGSVVVGRADDCDLVLEERRLSRRHARFYEEKGRWFVEDLGSPNGTFVNGRRVKTAALTPGDVVVLCKSTFRVVGDADSDTLPPPGPEPRVVKPLAQALVPDLESMLAEDYFEALGLGEETLHDATTLPPLLRKTRNFALLHEVTKAMQRRHDPQEMLRAVLDVVLKVTGADRGYAILVGDEGGFEVPVDEVRRSSATEPPQVSQTVVKHVLEDRSSVLCTDAAQDERFAGAESLFLNDTRALMAAPMVLADRVLGALVLESSHLGRRFDEADLDLLTVVAQTAGVGLDNRRLAKKREQTIRELEEAQARLLATQERLVQAEQMAALGRLSSGIAHEVKNHLGPFMLADMIAKKYADDAAIQDATEMMLEAQQHILDLVNEVRAFAQGNPEAIRTEPTDLLEVLKAILRFARCDKKLAGAKIELDARAEPVVELDPGRFRQVLINLLRNAADAVPEDRAAHIVVRVQAHERHVDVDVVDNGEGIPAEVADRVFAPFFTTKGDKGLGLGLDISRNIIRQHGGELGFSSEAGKGTTFRVRLPNPGEP